jgi:hypothetical protein
VVLRISALCVAVGSSAKTPLRVLDAPLGAGLLGSSCSSAARGFAERAGVVYGIRLVEHGDLAAA